jgi:hypothetical protein
MGGWGEPVPITTSIVFQRVEQRCYRMIHGDLGPVMERSVTFSSGVWICHRLKRNAKHWSCICSVYPAGVPGNGRPFALRR